MGADPVVVDGGMLAQLRPPGFQESPVRPRICVAPARAMYIGPALQLSPHRNAASTIAIAVDAPFTLGTSSPGSGWSDAVAALSALIPSGTLHHLQCHGPMVFLYLDPWTDRHHQLTPERLDAGRTQLLRAGPGLGIGEAFGAFGIQARVPADTRIAKVLQAMEQHPEAFGRLQQAAGLACLSPSRFRARFQAEVGLPFRSYRMWRRMARVMHTLAAGGSLTDAALAAGFASSAHLSSAFRTMFGLPASGLIGLGAQIDLSQDQAGR